MEEVPKQSRSRPAVGPGEFLGETRRELGLEPDNVAQILHLSKQQIEAIEANDFDNLPEPTYVRGYLRSYSQLLNVDPESVINSYNEAVGGWKTTTYSGLAVDRQISSKDNVVRFATIGVIGVVFGLAIVWWLGEDDSLSAVPAPTEVAAVPSNGNEENAGLPAVEVSVLEETPVSVVPKEPAPVKQPEAVKPVAPVAKAKPEEIRTPPVDNVENTQQPTIINDTTTRTTVAIRANPTVASGARAKLVLRTNGPSWADIRDANDNKLLYESVAAGRVVTVEGEAPLHVFLGNAKMVSLELNGVMYDFSQFRRGLTARFSVGGPAAGGNE